MSKLTIIMVPTRLEIHIGNMLQCLTDYKNLYQKKKRPEEKTGTVRKTM